MKKMVCLWLFFWITGCGPDAPGGAPASDSAVIITGYSRGGGLRHTDDTTELQPVAYDSVQPTNPPREYYNRKLDLTFHYWDLRNTKQAYTIKYYSTGLEKYRHRANDYVDSIRKVLLQMEKLDSTYNQKPVK